MHSNNTEHMHDHFGTEPSAKGATEYFHTAVTMHKKGKYLRASKCAICSLDKGISHNSACRCTTADRHAPAWRDKSKRLGLGIKIGSSVSMKCKNNRTSLHSQGRKPRKTFKARYPKKGQYMRASKCMECRRKHHFSGACRCSDSHSVPVSAGLCDLLDTDRSGECGGDVRGIVGDDTGGDVRKLRRKCTGRERWTKEEQIIVKTLTYEETAAEKECARLQLCSAVASLCDLVLNPHNSICLSL